MNQPRGPFEHHHHQHDDDTAQTRDPAQESLADALRVSFYLLRFTMLIVFVWYLLSNVFNVAEQEVCVRLRFGNIVGDVIRPDDQVLRPGGPYLAFPPPVDEVIKVPTTVQTLNLDDEFWFELTEADLDKSTEELSHSKLKPLNPEKDSYVVTGDADILHVRWTVSYSIGGDPADSDFAKNVIDYITHVGDEDTAAQLVRAATQRGVVTYSAGRSTGDFVDGLDNAEAAQLRRYIQQGLDDTSSGLRVVNVSGKESQVPNPVRQAFHAVTEAESVASTLREQAKKVRNNILNDSAGRAHGPLWKLIQDYTVVYEGGNEEATRHMEGKIDAVFESLNTGEDYGDVEIRGEVAGIVNEARTYRTQILNDIKDEAAHFSSWYDQYVKTPQIVTYRLWEDARNEMIKKLAHKFIIRKGKIVIQLNRDPKLEMKRAQEDLLKQEQNHTEQ